MTGGDQVLSILVAERNGEFRKKIKTILQDTYAVYEADSGIEAIEISNREPISLYLINCETPFISEKDYLQRFESKTVRPVLIYGDLAQCEKMAEKYPFIQFFERTGDVAAIRKIVDRSARHHFGSSDDPRYFKLLGIEIDYFQRRLTINGQEVRLTPKEFDLLVFLMTHTGNYFSRETLLVQVWGYDFLGDSRTIDTHIKSLRNKLGPYRNMVITIWGKGYKIELPEQPRK